MKHTFMKLKYIIVLLQIFLQLPNFSNARTGYYPHREDKRYDGQYDTKEVRSGFAGNGFAKVIENVTSCQPILRNEKEESHGFLIFKTTTKKRCYSACYTIVYKNEKNSYLYDENGDPIFDSHTDNIARKSEQKCAHSTYDLCLNPEEAINRCNVEIAGDLALCQASGGCFGAAGTIDHSQPSKSSTNNIYDPNDSNNYYEKHQTDPGYEN